jgi:hypothetical protein
MADTLKSIASGSIAASFTAALFSPVEMVKTRLQVQHKYASSGHPLLYRGTLHALSKIHAEEGIAALWRHGFAGFVMRDFCYSGLRIGMYPSVRQLYCGDGVSKEDAPLLRRIAAGMTTGGIGSALANPIDVVRVRTSVEGGRIGSSGAGGSPMLETGLRAGKRPRFWGPLGCLQLVWREGGASGLWRGCSATMARAALLSGAQLSSYDVFKIALKEHLHFEEGHVLHCICAVGSGLVAVTACNPADVVKSRMMSAGDAGRGAAATCLAIANREGLRGFYRGWLPAASRNVPCFFIQMPIVEELRRRFGLRPM